MASVASFIVSITQRIGSYERPPKYNNRHSATRLALTSYLEIILGCEGAFAGALRHTLSHSGNRSAWPQRRVWEGTIHKARRPTRAPLHGAAKSTMSLLSTLAPHSSLLLLFIVGCLLISRARRSRRCLPPGPVGRLIVGNLFNLPKTQPWLAYTDWGRQYGA